MTQSIFVIMRSTYYGKITYTYTLRYMENNVCIVHTANECRSVMFQ